jgi:Mg-chelatase subunit ChlD
MFRLRTPLLFGVGVVCAGMLSSWTIAEVVQSARPEIVLSYTYVADSTGQPQTGVTRIPLSGTKPSREMRASFFALSAGRAIQHFLHNWHTSQDVPNFGPAIESLSWSKPTIVFGGLPLPSALSGRADTGSGPYSRGQRFSTAVRHFANHLDRCLQEDQRQNGELSPALREQFHKLDFDLQSLSRAFENARLETRVVGRVQAPPRLRPTAVVRGNLSKSISANSAVGRGMALQSGGVMSDAGFWAMVANRKIPTFNQLSLDGFLKRFRLQLELEQLPDKVEKQLAIAVGDVLYFPESNRALVQVSMAALVDEATYVRPALNLVIGIDISGSMSSTDAVENGSTRMAGAKQAAIEAVKKLRPVDRIAIFTFDDKAEILREPTVINSDGDKQSIIDAINTLEPRGLTNIGKAEQLGFALLERMTNDPESTRKHTVQNRLVLITDAMVTAGELNESELQLAVAHQARKNFYTTVVGVGEGFSQSLAAKLASEPGGMFFFARNGDAVYKLFQHFDTRMITFATQFNVSTRVEGISGKVRLVASHGSGVRDSTSSGIKPDEYLNSHPVLEVPTLAFADCQGVDPSAGGGAFLFELQIESQ